MKVMDAARAIGIIVTDGDVSGTIDERKVLAALTDLANDDPANVDLFHDVAARVVLARSAGAEGALTSGTTGSTRGVTPRPSSDIGPRWPTCSSTWRSTSGCARTASLSRQPDQTWSGPERTVTRVVRQELRISSADRRARKHQNPRPVTWGFPWSLRESNP